MFKTVPQIYRDCLRTARHMAGQSNKGRAIASQIKAEFRRNADVEDPKEIDELKQNAVQALANYLTVTHVTRLKRQPNRAGDQNEETNQQK